MTYDEKIKRLEEIVSKLEEGGLSLDDSIKLYEEGTALSKECRKHLESAKIKIKTVTEDSDE